MVSASAVAVEPGGTGIAVLMLFFICVYCFNVGSLAGRFVVYWCFVFLS